MLRTCRKHCFHDDVHAFVRHFLFNTDRPSQSVMSSGVKCSKELFLFSIFLFVLSWSWSRSWFSLVFCLLSLLVFGCRLLVVGGWLLLVVVVLEAHRVAAIYGPGGNKEYGPRLSCAVSFLVFGISGRIFCSHQFPRVRVKC